MGSNSQKTRRIKYVLEGIFLTGLIAAGIWYGINWFTKPDDTQSPPPIHAYDGEKLSYEWRRGSYKQRDDKKTVLANGQLVELDLIIDQEYLSPAIGSKITGRVKLTANGRPLTKWPAGIEPTEWGESDQKPSVYLKTYGAYSWRCTEPESIGLGSIYSTAATRTCDPGFDYAAITQNPAPHTSSYIYSKQAVDILDQSQNIMATKLQLENGEAEFEFVYRSGRYAPYLEFEVFESLDQKAYARKIIPFQDQTSARIDTPKLDAQTGLVHYDVNFSTQQVTPEQPQLVELTVTANDPDGTPKTSADQRVRVSVYPMSYQVLHQQRRNLIYEWLYRLGGALEKAGEFVTYEPKASNRSFLQSVLPLESVQSTPEIAQISRDQKTIFYPGAQVIDTQLIGGQAKAYFYYTGKFRSISPQLIFVVEPINAAYELSAAQLAEANFGPAGGNYPSSFIEEFDLARAKEDQPAYPDPERTFLYETWFPWNVLEDNTYTMATLPIASPGIDATREDRPWLPTVAWKWALIGFVSSQVAKLLIYAVWLWRRRLAARKHVAAAPMEKPAPARPWRRKLKASLKRLGLGLIFAIMAGALVYSGFFVPVSNREAPIEVARRQAKPVPPKTIASATERTIKIEFDQDKLNPYPGGVTRGRVRVVDKNGKTVPISGIVNLSSAIAEFEEDKSDRDQAKFHTDYFGEIRGREMISRVQLKQAKVELRQEIDNSYNEKLLEENEHDIRSIGRSADGGTGDGEKLLNSVRKYFDDEPDIVTIPTIIEPASFALVPGCADKPGYEFSGIGGVAVECGPALVLRDGVAEFEYVNHLQQFGFVTFNAVAQETPASRLAIYGAANFSTPVRPSGVADTLLDARLIKEDGSSFPDDSFYGRAFTRLGGGSAEIKAGGSVLQSITSVPFGTYTGFELPKPIAPMTLTKLGYYYDLETKIQDDNSFTVTITHRRLSGYGSIPPLANIMQLQVAPGFDPDQSAVLRRGNLTNLNDDGEYVYPAEAIGQIYPAQLIDPVGGRPSHTIIFDISNQPMVIEGEINDSIGLLPFINLRADVWTSHGQADLPYELKFEDINRKSRGARSLEGPTGWQLQPHSKDILRTESPKTMSLATFSYLEPETPLGLPPSLIGKLFVGQQAANFVILLVILIRLLIKKLRARKKAY